VFASTTTIAQTTPVEPLYELFDVGTLGGSSSMALGMNELGHVVGWAETGSGMHAFLWRDGSMLDLGTLGGRYSEARDVNGSMEIVGIAKDESEHQRAFYVSDGVMYDLNDLLVHSLLPLPPGVSPADFYPVLLEANAINENGTIVAVGVTGMDDLVHSYVLTPVPTFAPSRPRFSYIDTGFLPAAVPSQPASRQMSSAGQAGDQSGQPSTALALTTVGFGLNDLDQIVGTSGAQAFVWLANDLGGLDLVAQTSQANAISYFGLIVGWTAGFAGTPHATLWSVWMPDASWSLYVPQGWISEARGINNFGEAVGWAADNPDGLDAVAMLWTGSAAFDLNEVTAVPEDVVQWQRIEQANAIDEQHRIAGFGRTTAGAVRAVVLVPIESADSTD
jgi:probable HAF family extracellular repeat protein